MTNTLNIQIGLKMLKLFMIQIFYDVLDIMISFWVIILIISIKVQLNLDLLMNYLKELDNIQKKLNLILQDQNILM